MRDQEIKNPLDQSLRHGLLEDLLQGGVPAGRVFGVMRGVLQRREDKFYLMRAGFLQLHSACRWWSRRSRRTGPTPGCLPRRGHSLWQGTWNHHYFWLYQYHTIISALLWHILLGNSCCPCSNKEIMCNFSEIAIWCPQKHRLDLCFRSPRRVPKKEIIYNFGKFQAAVWFLRNASCNLTLAKNTD